MKLWILPIIISVFIGVVVINSLKEKEPERYEIIMSFGTHDGMLMLMPKEMPTNYEIIKVESELCYEITS